MNLHVTSFDRSINQSINQSSTITARTPWSVMSSMQPIKLWYLTYFIIQLSSITLGFGLNEGVQDPAGAGNFPLNHRVQTGSVAHPASYPVGTRGSFPGGKAAAVWSCPLTRTVPRLRMRGATPPLPNMLSHCGACLKHLLTSSGEKPGALH